MGTATVGKYWDSIKDAFKESYERSVRKGTEEHAAKAELDRIMNEINTVSKRLHSIKETSDITNKEDKTNVLQLVKDSVPDEIAKEMAESLKSMKTYSSNIKELQLEMAKIRKSKYDAHVAIGFTPEQALELIKDVNQLV